MVIRRPARVARNLWLATLAVTLLACSNGSGSSGLQTSTALAESTCESVSSLQTYSYADNKEFTGYGLARAWHVWMSAFGAVRSGPARVADFSAGLPTKVVIHADPDLNQAVTLGGKDCSSGTPLHFCYDDPNNCGLVGKSFSANQLALMGSAQVAITSSPSVDYTGYMLFPRKGTYRLVVTSATEELGSVTIGVG